jgi:hypothetical protein
MNERKKMSYECKIFGCTNELNNPDEMCQECKDLNIGSSMRYPDKDPCWLLWEYRDGKVYLLSVCTDEVLAKIHMKTTREHYKRWNQHINVHYRLYIERSQMNHLYGRQER